MLNLGAVPACLRLALWSSLAAILRKAGRHAASEAFRKRAVWNERLVDWWEGDGPLPESHRAGLITLLDLAATAALMVGIIALAVWAKA